MKINRKPWTTSSFQNLLHTLKLNLTFGVTQKRKPFSLWQKVARDLSAAFYTCRPWMKVVTERSLMQRITVIRRFVDLANLSLLLALLPYRSRSLSFARNSRPEQNWDDAPEWPKKRIRGRRSRRSRLFSLSPLCFSAVAVWMTGSCCSKDNVIVMEPERMSFCYMMG